LPRKRIDVAAAAIEPLYSPRVDGGPLPPESLGADDVVRIVLGLFLVILAGQLSGVTAFVPQQSCSQDCSQDCEDEAPPEDCSPRCASCPCCASPAFAAAEPLVSVGPLPSIPLQPWPTVIRSSAHAREIFHVPKPALG